MTFYTRTLAVPARRDVGPPDTRAGQQSFEEIGCASCHVGELRTDDSDIAALDEQVIRPYTDLLLHDMGTGLADGRPELDGTGAVVGTPDLDPSGQEWRTPPLWGIGLVETVNGHTRFLHDGRARSLEEAILWHGGEAESGSRPLPLRWTRDRTRRDHRLPGEPVTARRLRLLVPLLVVALGVGACSDDEPADDSDAAVEVEDVLVAAADEVIVPSYEALVASFDALATELDELCTAPSTEQLEAARQAWREVAIAWRHTRAGGVGPAMDRRLASAIAFSGPARRGRRPPRRHRSGRRGRRRRDGRRREGHRRARDRALRGGFRGARHARRRPPLRVPHVRDRARPGGRAPRSWTTGPAGTATSSWPAWTATRRPAWTHWRTR